MSLWAFLEAAARRHPSKTAVADGTSRWSYGEFADRSTRLAAFFTSAGLRMRDRLAILDFNTHEYLESYFAAARQGIVLHPLNWRGSPSELAYSIRDSGTRWLVASPALFTMVEAILREDTGLEGIVWTGSAPVAPLTVPGVAAIGFESALREIRPEAIPPAVELDDQALAQLYYTSGTTGRPKGVMLTHGNVRIHALNAVAELTLSEHDIWGHVAPLFHLADAWATFAITAVGGTHVLLPRFDPAAALDLVEREGITLSNLVPTMLNLMVKHPGVEERRFDSLRLILSGGAPIAPALVRRIMEVFRCDYVQTYGMTETSPYLTMSLLPPHLSRLPAEERLRWKAKTGRPFRGVELRVVRDDGSTVAADGREVGEIQVRGPTVTPGYWNRQDETERAFIDGWLRTGDLAVLDHEGFVDIVDRKKDMIITGGEKVYSTEVEAVLYEHPAVLEAAVFGRPDALWGEAVTAAIACREGASVDESAIIAHCRSRLAGYKLPKAIEFLAELPKTGSGKISKRTLRDRSR